MPPPYSCLEGNLPVSIHRLTNSVSCPPTECDIEYKPAAECVPPAAHTNGERKARLDPYQDVVTDHLAKAEKIKVTIHPLIFQHVYIFCMP